MGNIIQHLWLSIKHILTNINLILMIFKISIAFTFSTSRIEKMIAFCNQSNRIGKEIISITIIGVVNPYCCIMLLTVLELSKA